MLSLLLFVLVATISPGGATTLAMASGMQYGINGSLPLVIGLAIGLAILAGTTSLGLAAVIHSSPQLSIGLKLAGSCYLIWLAWLVANACPPEESHAGQAPCRLLRGCC